MKDAGYLLNLIKTAPTAENFLNLSLAYYQAEMYYKCIEACKKSLAIKPDYALAYNNICSSLNKLGEWDKAIEAGKMALKIDPNGQLAKNNLKSAYQHAYSDEIDQ